MNKFLFFIFVLISCNLVVLGQQDPQFSQNVFNKMAFNPAYAGMNDMICIKGLYRNQYMGFPGKPTTTVFNIDMPISQLHGGLGVSVLSDKIGFDENTGMKLSYSYHWYNAPFGGKLGLGLSGGIYNCVKNGEWKTTNTPAAEDPAIPMGKQTSMVFTLGFGAFYTNNNYFVGVSSSQLNQSKFNFGIETQLKRHYYVIGGYNYTLPSNPSFVIKPSVLAKFVETPKTQFDLDCLIEYNKKFWAGLGYRVMSNDAVVIMAGLEIKQNLKIGFAYDVTMSQMGSASNGSIEAFVGYCFKIIIPEPEPTIYFTPRYL